MVKEHLDRRSRHHRDASGAAVVEFALIVPLLLSVVFAMFDYGLWFNESLNVRQGVRESARSAVVQNFTYAGCTGTDSAKLVCKTKKMIGPATGQAYVRVVVPPAGWKHGQPLLVCAMVRVDAVTGIVPLPANRLVKSLTSMSIEQDAGTTIPPGAYGDGDPSGANWTWCR